MFHVWCNLDKVVLNYTGGGWVGRMAIMENQGSILDLFTGGRIMWYIVSILYIYFVFWDTYFAGTLIYINYSVPGRNRMINDFRIISA